MAAAQGFEEVHIRVRDGLKLYARRYPAREGKCARPVLCLAGLTRNSRDFHDAALALSQHGATPRTVWTLDIRGRGASDFDPNWRNYAVPVELLDVIDVMTALELHGVAVIGTSRGGLIATLMAAVQPSLVGALVLNDIGPVIETDGLIRIAGYVGRVPLPGSWGDAAKMAQSLNERQFPNVPDHVWADVARAWYNEKNGRPSPGYDPNLSKALSVLDGPMPELWPQFEALKRIPVLVLRGENSDILSAATVEEMRRRHPNLTALTVAGQGHAPLLKDAASVDAIRSFLDAAEAATHAGAVFQNRARA